MSACPDDYLRTQLYEYHLSAIPNQIFKVVIQGDPRLAITAQSISKFGFFIN